jgi:branched-subunit amino acid transport protein
LESLTQLQTDTFGIIAALIYRTKFGGSWKISRKQFLTELEGFLAILPLIIVPSLVIDYVLSVEFGPSITEVSLPILAAGTVAGLVIRVTAGLIGGWIWIRIIRRTTPHEKAVIQSGSPTS